MASDSGRRCLAPVYREEPMRWIHAAGRGLLVLVVVMTGYVASGARAEEGAAGGRGPLTLATAGLLLYRKDILAKEGVPPPRTWAELEYDAKTIAPKYGLDGYAGQFLPYEGLTVNAAEAVYSAGGSILGDEGARVTVDSAA